MGKKCVLLVDDDKDMVEALRLVLESRGYEVRTAHNSLDGYKKAVERIPDLVVLDVMMETDTAGFQLAYKLRNPAPSENQATKKIPLLMLTAVGQMKGMDFSPEKDAEFLPVDEYMEKPVRPDELVSKVEKLLSAKSPGKQSR